MTECIRAAQINPFEDIAGRPDARGREYALRRTSFFGGPKATMAARAATGQDALEGSGQSGSMTNLF